MIALEAALAITHTQLSQEKERALDALQETHRQVSAILNSITDGFYTLD